MAKSPDFLSYPIQSYPYQKNGRSNTALEHLSSFCTWHFSLLISRSLCLIRYYSLIKTALIPLVKPLRAVKWSVVNWLSNYLRWTHMMGHGLGLLHMSGPPTKLNIYHLLLAHDGLSLSLFSLQSSYHQIIYATSIQRELIAIHLLGIYSSLY